MSSIDQQFIEYIVKSLVSQPDSVDVKRTIDEKGVLLELTVDPEDLGRVIGKRGATAQSLRTLLRALGTKNEARYNLKIVDNGEQPQRNRQQDDTKEELQHSPDSTEVADEVEVDAEDTPPDESTESEPEEENITAKTRKELADLDDLDV